MTKFKTKHKAHALRKTGAAALIIAATLTLALLFTACPNNAGGNAGNSGGGNSGGGGTSTPNHAVTFSVDGGNGTLKAEVDGSEIASGDKVEQGKIVEFSAMPYHPTQYTVDSWSINGGSFEAGTGTNGKPIAKVKVVQPVSVTVKFKRKPGPPPMPTYYSVTFGVDGGNGTLTAMVGSTEITSGNFVEQGKTVTFTAQADPNCTVEKWTNNGTVIAGAGTNTTYNHTITADANIKVKFKSTPVDVYVSGRSGDKAYVWKNGTATELRPNEAVPDRVSPYAVRSLGKNVYIAGTESVSGVSRPLVWEKNGSLLWIGTNRWSYAYDIAFYKGKTLVAGYTYDDTDRGASITDISDPGNPVVTFLYKKTPPVNDTGAIALYAGSGKLYAAGYKEDNTNGRTIFLWTKPDTGTVSELELGLEGNGTYTNNIPYGLCTAGSSVYVAAGNLWKVDGATVTPITVSDAYGLYVLCMCNGTVYAAGWTADHKAAVWKIEGTNVSLYKELSTDYSGVYALCVGRDDLHAAGFYRDTDNKHKAVWWRIAADGTLTENKLGTAEGEARGICVAPQE